MTECNDLLDITRMRQGERGALLSPLERLQKATAPWRIAIVHDWLVTNGGAEKVLKGLLEAFPQADVFTLIDALPEHQRGWLRGHRITTSFLQRVPLAKRYYQHFLPLMPFAIEQLDVSDYDIVISSSYAVAKGVVTHPSQTHICYCHTPVRYAWDMKESYLSDADFRLTSVEWLARYVLHRLRRWDYFTASQVDHYIANSRKVAGRIAKYYRRDAAVIYPPVDLEAFPFNPGPRDDYFLAASRLVPYKRLDLIVEAFRHMPDRRLKVVGDGPELKRLKTLAKNAPNIEILGYQPNEVLCGLMAHARAFIFAADEDFGILPLEAQACGTPVIAYGGGGALETVRGDPRDLPCTGLFFSEQTAASLVAAVEGFDPRDYSPEDCRRQAEGFSYAQFWQQLHEHLEEWLPQTASSSHRP